MMNFFPEFAEEEENAGENNEGKEQLSCNDEGAKRQAYFGFS